MEQTEPFNGQLPKATTSKEKIEIDLWGLLQGNKVEVAIYNLCTEKFKLKDNRYIPVTLQYEDLTYIFTQENLNLWGEARTLDEAEEEIAKAIVKLYEKLAALNEENKLGLYPKEQLTYLQEFIA